MGLPPDCDRLRVGPGQVLVLVHGYIRIGRVVVGAGVVVRCIAQFQVQGQAGTDLDERYFQYAPSAGP